ncbi:MAG: acyl carrier protein [Blastopirellula sp.]|nr:MAG: acyl carrier protein [Blastopirellula sp.]
MKETILTDIRDFIFSQFPIATQQNISDDTSLIDQGIIDSMGVLEIVTFIEEKYTIILDDDEMLGDNFHSIDALSKFVHSKLNSSVV